MNIYITSDLHLGHEKVAKLRGFNSVQAHDELVINRWNCHVRGNSPIVYVLGDVMMGDRDRGRKLLKCLRGELHLILGNHDRAAPNNKNGHRHIEAMGDAWASVTTSASISYNGQKFLMSHYPYDGDSQEESRFDQWRLRDLGTPLLHGHVHSDEVVTYSNLGTPQFHVGLDAWKLAPAPLSHIGTLLEELKT